MHNLRYEDERKAALMFQVQMFALMWSSGVRVVIITMNTQMC